MVLFIKIMMAEFIAEMGDKTQLMLIAMTSKFKLRDIIIGTAVAVMVLNALAVLLGGLVGEMIPDWLIKIIAALAFMFFAITSINYDDEDEEEVKDSKFKLGALAVFGTFFLAELGDKTQLTAITFGANEGISNALVVWGACSIGLFAADIIGMLIGYFLKSKTPDGALAVLAFVIFAIFGIVTMHTGLGMLITSPDLAKQITIGIALIFGVLCVVRFVLVGKKYLKAKKHNDKNELVEYKNEPQDEAISK
ncbi:MAG: TMEM165/GDT1 family protein [Eubacterium sp.]|nr:TMEM165/GDT1 family protein [Candidatus Colimonas fimequi]